MCLMCNGKTVAEVERQISGQIAQYGFSVICLPDTNPKRVLGYTVGLTKIGQPEFLVRGVSQQDTMTMLNGLGREVLRGSHYAHGHTAEWNEGQWLYFVAKNGAGKQAAVAYRRYGHSLRILEIHVVDRDLLQRSCPEHRNRVAGAR